MRGGYFIIAASMLAVSSLASASIFNDNEARKAILDLRQRVDMIKQEADSRHAESVKSLSEEDASIRRAMVDLQNQLNQARSDVENLRGQNEQLMRDVAELQRKFKDATLGLQERLRNLEPAPVTLDGLQFTALATETKEYEDAFLLFRNGDFAAAQRQFAAFLIRNPQSGYRPSVLFWLGNAQYANKDYKDALQSFRAMLDLAAEHSRAPEAMLAIANCQIEMKDTRAARRTWESLVARYPESEAASAARERISRFK
jgi:tol-pal system protein YbgF